MSETFILETHSSKEEFDKSSGGGEGYINYVPDGTTSVRFLSELTEWGIFREYYSQDQKRFYPVIPGKGELVPEDAKISRRWLCPVLLVDTDEVVTMKLPKTLVEDLWISHDRNGTVRDRDFDLIKTGEGLKTTYNAYPGDKQKRPLSKYEIPDVNEVFTAWCRESMADLQQGSFEDDDDVPPKRPAKKQVEDVGDELDDEPEFRTKAEREECREMLQELLVEDSNALNEMEIDELREYLGVFGKTNRSQSKSVLVRMLKKEIQQ